MDFDRQYFNLGMLDTLSRRASWLHRLDSRSKVLVTLAFVITVVSFPKYEVAGLIPCFLFPVLVFALADLPVWFILRKVLLVSVFAVLVGLFNPLLDTRIHLVLAGVPVSGGWLSFASIMLKCLLSMSAVLLLIATTSFPGICRALRKLGLPGLFVSQLLFLYRYLFVLLEEALRMVRARQLRTFGGKGLPAKVFVQLVGALFIRTVERSERIYQAMLSRAYTGVWPQFRESRWRLADACWLAGNLALLAVCRLFDLTGDIGRFAGRWLY